MRRMISQELAEYLASMKSGAVAEWVSQMKDVIEYDAENEKLVVGDIDVEDLSASGDVSVGGDVEVTGSIKGKLNTLQAYKSYDLTPSSAVGTRTFTNIYTKAIISGGLLLLIANFKLANKTESTISAGNISLILEVDDEIGDKIICFNGEKLSDDYTSREDIATMGVTSGIYLNSHNVRPISKIGKNKLEVVIYVPQLAVNDDIPFSGRQFLSLF